jgi:hypothetical protein
MGIKIILTICLIILVPLSGYGSITLEAETMTFIGSGNHRATEDGWALLGEGAMTETATFTVNKYNMEVVARGTHAGGAWPIMEVKVGTVVVATITVDSDTWKSFSIPDIVVGSGDHVVSVAFTNDYYEAPADRNFYLDKVILIEVLPILGGSKVTLAWDANTEEDLAGYKIHYGSKTRGEITNAIEVWCVEHEPNNAKCVEEWTKICTLEETFDPSCHSMLFGYDTVIDVRTSPGGWSLECVAPYDPFNAKCCEYTIRGLEEGSVYYFAGTAYDKTENTSSYSIELRHKFSWFEPSEPTGMHITSD